VAYQDTTRWPRTSWESNWSLWRANWSSSVHLRDSGL